MQSNPEEKEKSWRHHMFAVQLSYKVIVIKATRYWQEKKKARHTDQWNRNESPEINIHIWTINLQHRNKEYRVEKEQIYNKKCWKNCATTCTRIKLDHYFTPYTKIHSH